MITSVELINTIIKDYKTGLSINKLSSKYNKHPSTISRYLRASNTQIRSNAEAHTIIDIKTIKDEYLAGRSLSYLARRYGFTITGISKSLKRNGITIRQQTITSDWTFIVNKSPLFFYWLGWMLADGCIKSIIRGGRNRGISSWLVVHKNDIHILEHFRDIIKPSSKIKIRNNNCAVLSLPIPRYIYNILLQYGLIPNKTYKFNTTDQLLQLTKEQFMQLLVGFIEGDGSIDNRLMKSKNNYYRMLRIRFTGNNKLLIWIIDTLYNYGFTKRKLLPKSNPQFSEYAIAGKDAVRLSQLLLTCKYHRLSRKWDKCI